MADVLLSHANHVYSDAKQARKMQPYPPLQTLIVAGVLRQAGHSVALYDPTLAGPMGFRSALEADRPGLVAIVEDNFNFLSKMCLARNREIAFEMCAAAKARGVRVVVNGSDAADNAEAYLEAGADAVIFGEVESTISELAAAADGDYSGIAGLGLNSGRTAARQQIADLDALAQPAWDLADIEAYQAAWRSAHGKFSLNLVSSRGCPYRCNWCAKPIYGDSFRHHSPSYVADQLAHLKHTYQPDEIWFADDIFALSARWTREFAVAVAERDAAVPFRMQSRCDLMTDETAASLAAAGCAEVWMGAESGSQKVLDAMDKDGTVEQIARARENLRRHGIRACYFIQFGYPGETKDDIEQTVAIVRETQPDDIGVSVSYPLPGTKFHETVSRDLGAKRNWEESDDLAMIYRGAYSTETYRALRCALHNEVDQRNGREPRYADVSWLRVWKMLAAAESPDGAPVSISS